MSTSEFTRLLIQTEHLSPVLGKCFLKAPLSAVVSPSFSPDEIIARFNSGALLQIQHGNLNRAEALCLRALEICVTGADCGQPLPWLTAAFWPCVNLGRIAAACGKVEESLTIYRDLLISALTLKDLNLFGVRVPISKVAGISAAHGTKKPYTMLTPASRVYMTDSVRCLLEAELYSEATEFLLGCRGIGNDVDPLLWTELYCLSLGWLGHYDEVLKAISSSNGRSELSFVPLLISEAEACAELCRLCPMELALARADAIIQNALCGPIGNPPLNPAYMYLRMGMCSAIAGLGTQATDYLRRALSHSWPPQYAAVRSRALMLLTQLDPTNDIPESHPLVAYAKHTNRRLEKALTYICLEYAGYRSVPGPMAIAYILARSIGSVDSRRVCRFIEGSCSFSAISAASESFADSVLTEANDIAADMAFQALMQIDAKTLSGLEV